MAYLFELSSVAELLDTVRFAKERSLKINFIGRGANLLIADGFINEVFIRSDFKFLFELDSERLLVGSGVELSDLIFFSLARGFVGLETFAGIPGTVGGAAYINVHYFSDAISDFVFGGYLFDIEREKLFWRDRTWFKFGYDSSALQERSGKIFLVALGLKLRRATARDRDYALGRFDEIVRHRVYRYPYSRTCGSFFRNFSEEELSLVGLAGWPRSVAFYLDAVGVRRIFRSGRAVVSDKHSNMLVASADATSSDLLELARKMRRLVKERFGLELDPECVFIGFGDSFRF